MVGGLGAGGLEVAARAGLSRPAALVGLPDAFVTHGATSTLHESVGYTPQAVALKAIDVVRSGMASSDGRPGPRELDQVGRKVSNTRG